MASGCSRLVTAHGGWTGGVGRGGGRGGESKRWRSQESVGRRGVRRCLVCAYEKAWKKTGERKARRFSERYREFVKSDRDSGHIGMHILSLEKEVPRIVCRVTKVPGKDCEVWKTSKRSGGGLSS